MFVFFVGVCWRSHVSVVYCSLFVACVFVVVYFVLLSVVCCFGLFVGCFLWCCFVDCWLLIVVRCFSVVACCVSV